MAEILEVTDATFERDVLKSKTPVLVDFWAEWCGPCRALAPVVKEIADTYGERITVAKLDIDANPSVPASLSIRSIPTLLFFRDGAVVDSVVGAVPKAQVEQKVEGILAG
ncbi:MAG: thioredoxin [Myxococcota bacterium]